MNIASVAVDSTIETTPPTTTPRHRNNGNADELAGVFFATKMLASTMQISNNNPTNTSHPIPRAPAKGGPEAPDTSPTHTIACTGSAA
jgi:hypothetical protein